MIPIPEPDEILKKCPICQKLKRIFFINIPCGHASICSDCDAEYADELEINSLENCPKCRIEIEEKLIITAAKIDKCPCGKPSKILKLNCKHISLCETCQDKYPDECVRGCEEPGESVRLFLSTSAENPTTSNTIKPQMSLIQMKSLKPLVKLQIREYLQGRELTCKVIRPKENSYDYEVAGTLAWDELDSVFVGPVEKSA